jgi:DnaJ-class molecular chaperone
MSDRLHTKRKIVICWKCNGTGEIGNDAYVPAYVSTGISDPIIVPSNIISLKTEYNVCDECKGTGRLIKTKKWSLFFEPFNIKEIHKNIRHKLNEKD